MAIVARALLREFPDHVDLFSIGALQLGRQYIPNHNGLLGRYPGADGMKTGFTCPAGFNVVASANHSGRRLIVVVLGAPTAKSRNQEAADLFDRGFAAGGGNGWWNPCLRLGPSAQHARQRLPPSQRGSNRRCRGRGRRRTGPGGGGICGTRWDAPHSFGGAIRADRATPSFQTEGSISIRCPSTWAGARWKGPALGARRTATETPAPPDGVKTISAASAMASTPEGDARAPTEPSSRSKLKLSRHSEKRMAAHKSANGAPEKLQKKDVSAE